MVKAIISLHFKNDTEKRIERKYEYDCKDYYAIYDLLMLATDGDHEIAQDVASWCEIASIGEMYELREGTIEIVDDWN